MSSKSKNKISSLSTAVASATAGAAAAAANNGAVAVLPLASVLETRVPVVLIVGGAGVGKTSVAAAVLHDAVKHEHLRVLALVPDISSFRHAYAKCGGSPIDSALPIGVDVVQVAEEVSGGCVCCTVRRDIEDVLADEALAGAPSFDLVVIDTASSSDPMPVIATLFEEHANEVVTPEVSQSFHLDAVVCVVDGSKLDGIGSTVHEARQLAFADVIVVTKARNSPKASGSNNKNKSGNACPTHQSSSKQPNKQVNETSLVSKSSEGSGFLSGGEGLEALRKMSKSVTLSTSYPPGDNNRFCLSASTSATSPTPLLSEAARKVICEINPLVQIKELPPGALGEPIILQEGGATKSSKDDTFVHSCPKCREIENMEKQKKKKKSGNSSSKNQSSVNDEGSTSLVVKNANSGTSSHDSNGGFIGSGEVIRLLVGFNTYCAAAFDRLDLSGLLTVSPQRNIGSSGVVTTVVFAEGRLMQRRFRDCMSALLRLCKENIFRMRGELCYAETEDARWLFHAVHSVVTISESEHRPWGKAEPRVNLLVVTGHDLPISELYACLRMSLIEEAEKSADAMAQALLAEIEGEGNAKSGGEVKEGEGGDGSNSSQSSSSQSKKAKKKAKDKQLREAKELKKKEEARLKAEQAAEREAKLKAEREEKLRAKILEERKIREEKEMLWEKAEAERRRQEMIEEQKKYENAKAKREGANGTLPVGTSYEDMEDYELQAALKASLLEASNEEVKEVKRKKNKKNKNKTNEGEDDSVSPVSKASTKSNLVPNQSSTLVYTPKQREQANSEKFYFCSACGERTREVIPGPQGSLLCNSCGSRNPSNKNRPTSFNPPGRQNQQDRLSSNQRSSNARSSYGGSVSQKWCIGCDDKNCTSCLPSMSMITGSVDKMNLASPKTSSSRPITQSMPASKPMSSQHVQQQQQPPPPPPPLSMMESSMFQTNGQHAPPGILAPPPGFLHERPSSGPRISAPPGVSMIPSYHNTVDMMVGDNGGNGQAPPMIGSSNLTGDLLLDEPLEPDDETDNIDLDFLDNLDQADLGELESDSFMGSPFDNHFQLESKNHLSGEHMNHESNSPTGGSRLMGLFGGGGDTIQPQHMTNQSSGMRW